MSDVLHYPAWDRIVTYGENGPSKRVLAESDTLKYVLVGLGAFLRIPPHPTPTTVFHVLEGNGWLVINGERTPIEAKETIVAPAGVRRGLEAESRMTLLVTHGT
jgi:quercetin dioxygenase-like cupin family protein